MGVIFLGIWQEKQHKILLVLLVSLVICKNYQCSRAIGRKTAYAAYAKFAAHQVSISLSQNAKAKEYLNNQLKEIKEKLKQYENVVNEYKK
jgi:hypothetical protein